MSPPRCTHGPHAPHGARTTPRANDFARRGGWEARIAAHLREDDPEAAIQVARGLVDRLTSPIGQVVCRGLLGVILAALGRDDQAHAVLAPVIDTQRPFGFFVHLARALLGLPATFAALADRKDIEAWRAGRPLLKEGPVTDQRFVFAWALSRRPHSG